MKKVEGNFHVAPGKSFQSDHMHIHDLEPLDFADRFDLSHKINKLSFGEPFPCQVNPLDGVDKQWSNDAQLSSALYQYYIKVVPTEYLDSNGVLVKTNQYSVTEHERPIMKGPRSSLPGTFCPQI